MVIDRYHPAAPEAHWEPVRAFVQAAAAEATPHVPYPPQRITTDVTALAIWGWQVGLTLDRETLLHRDVIEAYVVHGCPHLSSTSAGNRRSTLLRIAEALLPATQRVSRLTPLCNPTPSAPYDDDDVTELRSWARGQINAERRRDGQTLLSLGLGAGLSAREIKTLRIADITVDDDGVLIRVPGDRPRDVPVLATWEDHLAEQVANADPDELVFAPGRTTPSSRNSITNFVARTSGNHLKPNSHRLRATWIIRHLACGTPLIPLMEAAGLQTLEVLDRYMMYVPGVTDIHHARALLRRKLDISPGLRSV